MSSSRQRRAVRLCRGLRGGALLVLSACAGVPGEGPPSADLSADPWRQDRPDLEVRVLDDQGAPVPEVWVVLSPSGRDALTDADGVASFARLALANAYEVSVSAPGMQRGELSVTFTGEDASVELVLQPQALISEAWGQVRTPSGAPVEGAVVSLGQATATTDAAGAWRVEVEPGVWSLVVLPPEGNLLPWSAEEVAVPEAGSVQLDVVLPGSGSTSLFFPNGNPCGGCHRDELAQWEQHPHARAARTPEELVDEPGDLQGMVDAFDAGEEVALDHGALVSLTTRDGLWLARVEDAEGQGSEWMEVVEVYGGHEAGAALAVDAGGSLALLPLAWALRSGGASSAQLPPGWVPAWTEGWLDADGTLSLSASEGPGPAASFDLRCAGCHATAHALVEEDGAYALAAHTDAVAPEAQVTCEACHGPGWLHFSSKSQPKSDTILNPARLPAQAQVQLCARCHQRSLDEDHPFDDTPGWPVDAEGDSLLPWEDPLDHARADPELWLEAPASARPHDEVGELLRSPHHQGPGHYLGLCTDCHDAHGSEHPASLHVEPTDNTLCTVCHSARFPDLEAEAAHVSPMPLAPGAWSPGACTSCHMPRTATLVRPDPLSGAGELHSHTLKAWNPAAALAEFDAAGAETLPLGSVPTSGCVDCHAQAQALAEEQGESFSGPTAGDPTQRSTYESMGEVYETALGGRP